MSQIFTWPCKGKCGVELNDQEYNLNKKWCDECYKKKRLIDNRRYQKRKYTTVPSMILYCVKQQPCNTGMLMAYCKVNHRSNIANAVMQLRMKYNITFVDGFYRFGGEK